MSDNIIALLIPVVMIAITFVWVPMLNLICPPCQRSSAWQSLHETASKTHSALLFRSHMNPDELAVDPNSAMTAR